MTNEIVTINTSTLVNKELAKELNNISTALAVGNNCVWDIARAYANICNNELFEEDFENKQTFSEFVGVSKATMTQYTKAVDFIDVVVVNNEMADKLTVSKAYILSGVEDLGGFIDWLYMEKDIKVWEISDKALKKFIKEYDTRNDVEDEIEELEEVEDEIEELEEVEKPTKEDVIKTIKELMEHYNITVDDLR